MNYTEEFNDSFERNVSSNYEVFFKTFYSRLEAKSPRIRELFEHTSAQRRYEMLEDSILMLMECSLNMAPSKDIQQLAEFHQARHVPLSMYKDWLDALIEALYQLDESFCEQKEEAWRAVLAPGIRYMCQGYS